MRFKRPAIVTHIGAGTYQNGYQTTTANETQTEVNDLVLGDGAASHAVVRPDGTIGTVLSTLIPITANAAWAVFEFDIDDNRQVFANINIVAFGAGGMANLLTVIEFQDPHYPNFWIPSLEGVARTSGTVALHTITLAAAGSYVIASRQEHRGFKKVRFRFQADAAADATTEIWTSWFTDGATSKITDTANTDTAKVWA